MQFARRLLAASLALLLSGSPALAGENVKIPEQRPDAPLVGKPELPPIPPALASTIPNVDPAKVAVETAQRPAALQNLQDAQPAPSAPDAQPKSGEAQAQDAASPFTGAASAAPAQEPVVAAPLAPATRAELLVAHLSAKRKAVEIRNDTLKTWIKSGVAIAASPWLVRGVVSRWLDGAITPATAKIALAAMMVYPVYLMARIVYNAVRAVPAARRADAALRAVLKALPGATLEQRQKALSELEAEAPRYELAEKVTPQFEELFGRLRAYGPTDDKMTKDVDYLRRFLREVKTGERDHWTVNSMSYHLLTGSEDALDELRARVWNDRMVSPAKVFALEDQILALRESLGTDHQSGYRPDRELKFLADRMDDAYDGGRKELVDRQLARLSSREVRERRRATAASLLVLRREFDKELKEIGSDPEAIDTLKRNNRRRVEKIVEALGA